MTKRRAITDKMKWQALFHRYLLPCALCGTGIFWDEEIEWDHSHPLALGGRHHPMNIRPLHIKCHREKTSGSKATSAGSDIHKIAKVKRIVKGAAVTSSPKIMSGQWCIAGTRIPAIAIKHFHKDGYTIGAIIEQYPTLTREQVQAAIDFKPPKPKPKLKSRPFPAVPRPMRGR